MSNELLMRYIGTLGALCECSVQVDEDNRECIETALADAERHHGLKWRRVLDRIEIMGFSTDELYYIHSTERKFHQPMWWSPNKRGYTADLDKAGKYTKKEAEEIYFSSRKQDIPYLCSVLDARSVRVADGLHDGIAHKPTKEGN